MKTLLLAAVALAAAPAAGQTIAITGGTVLPIAAGEQRAAAIEHGTVLVENGRITAVGPARSVTIPDGVRTVDQLIATGKAEHPMIGVSLDRRWTNEGAKVLEDSEADSGDAVVPGGPADDAGVEPGDVITQLDGRRVTDVDQLITRIRAKAVGDKVTLTVRRDGKEQELTMTLEAAKES